MQVTCYKTLGVIDLPLTRISSPRFLNEALKWIRKLGSKVVFMLPCCFCFHVVAPLDLEVLDGAASSVSLSLIQNADGPLTVGQIRLKLNGLVIDVLVEIRLD